MPEFMMSVRGMKPVPWGGRSNEKNWRKVIANKAREMSDNNQFIQVSGQTQFAVSIVFFMSEKNIQRSDLDNLAKPVLDTLFHSRRPQVKDMSLTGALFSVDDDRVFKLNLEKQPVEIGEDEGIDVKVVWE